MTGGLKKGVDSEQEQPNRKPCSIGEFLSGETLPTSYF